jgi:hypothetical protein
MAMLNQRGPWVSFGSEVNPCRNIKTLFNFDPPVTHEEVRAPRAPVRPQGQRPTAVKDERSGIQMLSMKDADDDVVSAETNAPPKIAKTSRQGALRGGTATSQ